MKKIVFGLVGLFIVSQLMVSCSADNEMLSQFSKRKYLKKFKSKDVKYEDKVGELETEIAYEVKQEEVITASIEEQVTSVEVKEQKTVEVATLTSEQQEQIVKVKTLVNDYSKWNKYNRRMNFSNVLNDNNRITNTKKSVDTSDTLILVLLVVLALIVSPLTVFLVEGATPRFWWTLLFFLLSFTIFAIGALGLFWLVAFILAMISLFNS